MIRKLLLLIFVPYFVFSATWQSDSLTQYGITIYFNQVTTCGQFANGDYWAIRQRVDSITPKPHDKQNGWNVNPDVSATQPYDSSAYGYDASTMPSFPYTPTDSIESIVCCSTSTVNGTNQTGAIQVAVVFTLCKIAPPFDSGSNSFRPAYGNCIKTYYDAHPSSLNLSAVPSVVGTADSGTIASYYTYIKHVQIHHNEQRCGRTVNPVENYPSDYGPDIMKIYMNMMLRICLTDAIENKLPTILAITQAGIDWYHMMKDDSLGIRHYSMDGHYPCQSLIVGFSALMVNDTDMKTYCDTLSSWHEKRMLYESDSTDSVLFGTVGTAEVSYWDAVLNLEGDRSVRDPYQKIDGGYKPGDYYQDILSGPWCGYATFKKLCNVNSVLNCTLVDKYYPRWYDHGTLTLPDPCVACDGVSGNRGTVWGEDPSSTDCIRGGSGRFAATDGFNKGLSTRNSDFQLGMWALYRNYSTSISKRGIFNCSWRAK